MAAISSLPFAALRRAADCRPATAAAAAGAGAGAVVLSVRPRRGSRSVVRCVATAGGELARSRSLFFSLSLTGASGVGDEHVVVVRSIATEELLFLRGGFISKIWILVLLGDAARLFVAGTTSQSSVLCLEEELATVIFG